MQKLRVAQRLAVFGVLIGVTLALATPALATPALAIASGLWTPTAIVCNGDAHTITITGDFIVNYGAPAPVTIVEVNGAANFPVQGGFYSAGTYNGLWYTYSDGSTFNVGDTVDVTGGSTSDGAPIIPVSLTTTCLPGGGGIDDGRINTEPWGRVAIYCDGDTFSVYSVNEDGSGNFLYEMDFNAPPTNPAVNTLVKNVGDVWLFRLTSGEWEIVRGPDSEGKIYAFVFSECAISYNNYDASFTP